MPTPPVSKSLTRSGARRARPRAPLPTHSAAVRASPSAVVTIDVAAEADDEVEFQFLGQDPIQLVIAEATIGHDADVDIRRAETSARRTRT